MKMLTPAHGTKRRTRALRRSLIAIFAIIAAIVATLTLSVGTANAASTLTGSTNTVSSPNVSANNVTYTVSLVTSITETIGMLSYSGYGNGFNADFTNATLSSVTGTPGITGATIAYQGVQNLMLGITPMSVPAGTTLTFVIAGVTNQANTGSYTVAVAVGPSTTQANSEYQIINSPTFIAPAGALTAITQTMSSTVGSATGVTWTVKFTTATAGIIGKFAIAGAPTGQSSIGIGSVLGINPGSVSYVSGSGLTYTVTTPITVPAATAISVQFTGITNPAAGTYASSTLPITTSSNAATPVTIDTGFSPTLVFSAAAVTPTVRTLGFTIDSPSYTLSLDPSIPALADVSHTVNLTVTTNAGQGYSITMADSGLKTAVGSSPTVHTIAASSALTSTTFAANTFGVSAVATASKSLATVPSRFAGSNISGYSTTATTLVAATQPTGTTTDTIAVINRVKIDYNTAAGNYTDTITYTAIPSF